jgi:threonine synthase
MAVSSSRGAIVSVDDSLILEAQRRLAREEGVGVEPASAAPLAAYGVLAEEGLLDKGEEVVFVATGHALKDPGIPLDVAPFRVRTVDELEALLK